MKKVLILRPASGARGGISNYYDILEKYFSIPIDYFIRGARKQPHDHSGLFLSLLYLYDIIRFVFLLTLKRYSIIHINTSLGIAGLYRDAIFIRIAKLFNKKVIVFFRGLDQTIQERIFSDLKRFFTKNYFKADIMIVLSKGFADKLVDTGYTGKVKIETTVVDNKLIDGLEDSFIDLKASNINHAKKIKLLFLARIEKEKGIYETIDAFDELATERDEIELTIAGDGKELESVKKYVKDKGIKKITFTGFVKNEMKRQILKESDIYLLPSYNEGMPNSVLEAMAFGLPVVATKVGGIPDVVVNRVNGFLIEDASPLLIKEALKELITDNELFWRISLNNFRFAKERYCADKVVKRLENYYRSII